MNKSMLKFLSKLAVVVLFIFGLLELALALWTVLDNRYKSLAYNLADVGYIDLWVLRYLSMCLFASSIITLVMCLILIWGLWSAHVFLFIASTMISLVMIAEFTIALITFTHKFDMRLVLQEQLPKLVITYRQSNDERANRALDFLQSTFHCCGSDGRLSFQNNVPFSCNMYSIGCLFRTMDFLDSCMDALAYTLLFISLIKLFIVLYFYSFLCVYHRNRPKEPGQHSHRLFHDPNQWRQSSSFDSSSSTENLPKKLIMQSSAMANQDENDYVEKRRIILNEYESSSPSKRVQAAAAVISPSLSTPNTNLAPAYYEQQTSRKLSSISEKTERTETDESESDLVRGKEHQSKRKALVAAANQKQQQYPPPPLPKKLPTIKNRQKTVHEDENENDSGVERSSSEKSFDEQNNIKRRSGVRTPVDTGTKAKSIPTKSSIKSPPSLSFSNVFVTSVSQMPPKERSPDDEAKKPLTTSSSTSSSLSDHFLLNDITPPKPILKKSPQQSPPSYSTNEQDRIPPSYLDQKKMSSAIVTKPYMKLNTDSHTAKNRTNIFSPFKSNIPKPAPRPSLKHSSTKNTDSSLV